MPEHSFISSVDYINSLEFDHVESWSFQRGADHETYWVRIAKEQDALLRKRDRNAAEEERLAELLTPHLIDAQGRFHPSSRKVNTFGPSDPRIAEIRDILGTEIKNVPMTRCLHVYRDALVFMNGSRAIVSTLNVCLGCLQMGTRMFELVNADETTYEALRQFFIRNGHDVEDDSVFG